MRVVFDSNVLAQVHQRAQGPARRALLHVTSGSDTLILSPYILWELERILTYPRLLKRLGLSPGDIAEYLENLAQIASLVTPKEIPKKLLRDPPMSQSSGRHWQDKLRLFARVTRTF